MNGARAMVVTLTLLALPAVAGAGPQEVVDAAFGLQEQGATLTDVRAALDPHRGEDAVDFALGAVDFLIAGEGLVQRAHRHGFLSTLRTVAPWFGGRAGWIEWIANDQPDPTAVEDLRTAIGAWVTGLEAADETLAATADDFKCVIAVSDIRFDIDADGRTTSAESLRALFRLLPSRVRWNQATGQRETMPLVPGDLAIAFDRGDAAWLQGYCNILMAVGEWMLAHDWAELFDHTGHVFFPKAEITYDYLPGSTFSLERLTGGAAPTPFDPTDVVAFIGNMRLPIEDAERMRSVLEHLRAAVDHGHRMWRHYDRETDDDREWIPNPRQSAAFHELRVDDSMRDAWLLFLDEAEAILAGRKVLRFWRGDGTRGIDVPQVFLEPREFDLLYWIQGSAAAPYLREGEFTTPGTWAQLEQVFNRRIFRYSFWFN